MKLGRYHTILDNSDFTPIEIEEIVILGETSEDLFSKATVHIHLYAGSLITQHYGFVPRIGFK